MTRMNGAAVDPYIVEFIHKNGEKRWGEIYGTLLRDQAKQIVLDIIMVIDVTKRKTTIQKLQESELKFRQFFECSPDYCYMISPDGAILDLNEKALMVLDYKKSDIIGKPIIPTIYPKSMHDTAHALVKKWNQHHVLKNEALQIVTRQGTVREVLLDVADVTDSRGNLIYSILMQKDITDIKQSQHLLVQSEEKYQEIFDHADNIIQCVDDQGHFLEVNPKWVEILGYTKEEASHLLFTDILRTDQLSHCHEIFRVIKRGESVPTISTVFVSKSGTEIPVEGRTKGIFKDGKFLSSIGIFHITSSSS